MLLPNFSSELESLANMVTITARKKTKSGKTVYTAQIRIFRSGKTVHSESQTFERKKLAQSWLNKRQSELDEAGGLERAKYGGITLADDIDQYLNENGAPVGRTETQALRSLKTFEIADMACADITSTHIITLARQLKIDKQPQTVANYLSHLASIFAIAKPAWA